MQQRDREIPEQAVRTLAEQAVNADELVDMQLPPVGAIIPSWSTRRYSGSSS